MILITGGTGFIGRVLIRQLTEMGYEVRTLIRPSTKSPNLPRGVSIEIAVSSLRDEHGLRAAMKGVDIVYHLAGVEGRGSRADLMETDLQGTQATVQAAKDAGVSRFFFISHLGADRASAFPVLKAKAICENYIRQSGIDYTVFRSGIVYGMNDHFTTGLSFLLHAFPGIFLIPGDGLTLLQPIWVEDLVTCMIWALDDPNTRNKIIQVGGPEFISIKEIIENIMAVTGVNRLLIPFSPAYMRILTAYLEEIFPAFPVSVFWIDYLASDRTCGLDILPREFGLIPARFNQKLDYLRGKPWQSNLWRLLFSGKRKSK
jgi:nucleoside-diphosphate-sugar epimerase